MRLFIAINFEDAIKEYLKSVQARVKNISTGGNFSREENLHLTLVFLGEVSPMNVKQIEQAMDEIKASAFALTLSGVGRFKQESGDLLWVGVKPNDSLSDIYDQLRLSLKNRGFSLESRAYTPHLTLARELRLTDDLKSVSVQDQSTLVSKVSLMKSERLGGKLVYTEIYAKRLV